MTRSRTATFAASRVLLTLLTSRITAFYGAIRRQQTPQQMPATNSRHYYEERASAKGTHFDYSKDARFNERTS